MISIIQKTKWFLNRKHLKNIKLIILDIDGVLTDGYLYFDSQGNVSKKFSVRDGLGIRILQENGLIIVFLSGGLGGASEHRAKQLNIFKCITEIKDKNKPLIKLQKELNIRKKETIYVGDDLNDLVVKNNVRFLISTNDASYFFKKKADLILDSNGGEGAIRELSEKILFAKGLFDIITKKGWKDLNH